MKGRQKKTGGEEGAWRLRTGSVGCIPTAHLYTRFVFFDQRADNGTTW